MLNISKPLNAAQAATYHAKDFTSKTQSYYSEGRELNGEWQGGLAGTFGLSGEVSREAFMRLAEGNHPQSGQEMVRSRMATEYTNADRTFTKSVSHRAGWDATFSAPKSVSLTALVGGDDRVREAHREAVTAALTELERYTQARIGSNNPAETTGRFIAAKFEHDTARPVDDYAAPQLHTHAVIFNVTTREDGSTRALDPRSLFESQAYATAVYQSHLMYRLRQLGYEIESGRSGAPEIKGYSQEYLDASSPRAEQIKDHLAKAGRSGPEAAQFAAYATRQGKQKLSKEEVLRAHQEIAKQYGNQPARVIAATREQVHAQIQSLAANTLPKEAMSFARDHLFERDAVADERSIMTLALRRGMAQTTLAETRAEYRERLRSKDFQTLASHKYDSGQRITTADTLAAERANIDAVRNGRNSLAPIMKEREALQYEAGLATREGQIVLNDSQKRVVHQVLTSSDRVHGLQGLAGTGKTTTLASIREGAEMKGYEVEGFAPTSRAAAQLREAGITATTLQSFLVRKSEIMETKQQKPHLYMLDEASLASTNQMRAFLDKLQPQDRVLVIGDTRQHQGIEAGRPFQQMQEAGMQTAQLDQIIRQRSNPDLLAAVQYFATGETRHGVELLAAQGRITEVANNTDRITAIARDYVAQPESTIVISPDNKSRQLINEAIRRELQQQGHLSTNGYTFQTLAQRSELTGAARKWAGLYRPGDYVRYERGSEAYNLDAGSTYRVVSADPKANIVTVEHPTGETVSYDPRRAYGVKVFEERTRNFSVGDRLQFTAANKDLDVSNRTVGAVTGVSESRISVRLDGKHGRTVTIDTTKFSEIDHAYALTSHSAQGLTVNRVIANIDTELNQTIVNDRLAYVAISRAENEARIYTNDAAELPHRLANNFTKSAAIELFTTPEAETATPKHRSLAELLSESKAQLYELPEHRMAAVAQDFLSKNDKAVVLAGDPSERKEITQLIRADLYAQGRLSEGRTVESLIERQVENRQIAKNYNVGDVIRYGKVGSQEQNIAAESYGRVVAADGKRNLLTVESSDGGQRAYNPAHEKRLSNESKVYTSEKINLAVGDRVQLTCTDWESGLVKGHLGTVEQLSGSGDVVLKTDNGKTLRMTPEQSQHLTHGYAVNSPKRLYVDRAILTGNEQQISEQKKALTNTPSQVQEVGIIATPGNATAAAAPTKVAEIGIAAPAKVAEVAIAGLSI